MKTKSLMWTGVHANPAVRTEGRICECGLATRRTKKESEAGISLASDSSSSEIRATPLSDKSSDLIIVLVLADNARECDGYDQELAQHRRPRRILIEGRSVGPAILEALRAGASNAIAPHGRELLATVVRALEPREQSKQAKWRQDDARAPFANLTPRQREIMDLVLAGHPNKIIAADLGISQRTVENHRASVMKKTGAKSLPALVRLAMFAGKTGHGAPTSQH
jgi:FixJ family two-component response regulator